MEIRRNDFSRFRLQDQGPERLMNFKKLFR